MLAASTFGITSTLASPSTAIGNSWSRIVLDSAASPRISPSTASWGSRACDQRRAHGASCAPTARQSCRSSSATAGRRWASRRSGALPRPPAARSRRPARRRVAVDMGVADEELAPGQHQHLHRGQRLRARRAGRSRRARGAGGRRSCRTCRTASRRRGPGAPASRPAACSGCASRRAPARATRHRAAQLVVVVRRVAVDRRVQQVDEFAVVARLQAQAELRDALRDHLGPAQQQRTREALVDHHLRRTQHALVFAFGVDTRLGATWPRRTPAASLLPDW